MCTEVWEKMKTRSSKFVLGSLLLSMAFILSACGSPKDTSDSKGPIDGTWTINSGISGNPTNLLIVTKDQAVLKIFSNTGSYSNTPADYASCVIALQFALSYPTNNQLTIQSQPSQAGDVPVGCASKTTTYAASAQQVAQNFQAQTDGTYNYVTNQNAAGTHVTLTSTKNSGSVIQATKSY